MISAAIGSAGVVVVAFIGRDARRAAKQTRPNGHGPLPEAVGDIIDTTNSVETKLDALTESVHKVHAKVDRVIQWAGAHDYRHEFEQAREKAAEELRAELATHRHDDVMGKPTD